MAKRSHSIGFYVQCIIVAIAAACAIGFRATVEYASDTPVGMAIGAVALLSIGATVLLGLLRRRHGVLGRLARSRRWSSACWHRCGLPSSQREGRS